MGDDTVRFTCLDFTGAQAQPTSREVVIQGGRVSVQDAAGPPAEHGTPWFLLPGLSDAHVHTAALKLESGQDFLSCGVTHVRDVGGPLSNTLYWSQCNDFPEVTHYGWAIDCDPPAPHARLLATVAARTPDSVVRHVRRLKRFGASGLKLYYGFPPEWVPLAVRTAHEHGLHVAYHLGSGSHPKFRVLSVHDAIRAGVDSIEHIHSLTGDVLAADDVERFAADDLEASGGAVFYRTFRAWAQVDVDAREPRAVIDRFVDSGTVFVPTLAPFAAMIGEVPAIDIGVVSLFRDSASPDDVDTAVRGLARMLEFVRAFVERGGRIALGTDTTSSTGVSPRTGVRSELNLLLRAGLEPTRVLSAATVPTQRALGVAPRASMKTSILVRGDDLRSALEALSPTYVIADDRVIYTRPASS